MKKEAFNVLYSRLIGSFPKTFEREGMRDSWVKIFEDRNGEYFEKTVNYFTRQDRDDMPSTGSALAVYKRIAEAGQGKRFKDSKGHEFPPMTEAEAVAEYRKITDFMEHYPCPTYPAKASASQCKAIDRAYSGAMKAHGINTDEDTHPMVAKYLMADLNEKLGYNVQNEATNRA